MDTRTLYISIIKTPIDFLLAVIVLLGLFPLFLLIILLLFLRHRSVFYFQKRPGKNSEIFEIIKFETLNSEEKANSRLRKLIRKSHLNEIPQLINILKGDMSWVGPRPLLPEYLSLYSENQKKRHLTKPGIFGLAQLEEAELQTWEKKFELDINYVENISFSMDMQIILKSIEQALNGKLFNRAGSLEKFKG